MSVNLVREPLKLDRMIGTENLQTLVKDDMVVPDSKPDIGRVLSVGAKINITDKEIIQGKIVVDGVVNFTILYVPVESDQPLHSLQAAANFSQNIEMDDIDGMMKPEVDFNVEYIDYDIMNERKISLQAVLNLTGKVFKSDEIDILKDVEGMEDLQVLKDVMSYNNSVGSNSSQTVLRETYELAEDTPEIFEILKVDGSAVPSEMRVTEGKVIVGGNINLTILYATEEPRNPVNELKHEIPFTHFIEMPKALADMDCKVDLKVDDIFTDIKENLEEQKKVYDVEIVIKAFAEVYDQGEREVLLDLYSPYRNLNIQKSNLKYSKNVGRDSSQTVVKETLDVLDDYPSIFKVCNVDANSMVTDYRLLDNKVIIEGFVEANVVYIADNDEMEMYSFKEEIPFRHFIEMPGINENMEAYVKANLDNINYSSINSKQVETKFSLTFYGEISEEYEKEIVVNLEDLGEIDEEDNRASITVYFVQEGDTLWEIAKRYNTTVKEILEANDIEDPDMIMPGDQIIIQKTYEYKF